MYKYIHKCIRTYMSLHCSSSWLVDAMFYIFIFFVYQFIKCILSNSFEADFEAHFVAGDVALLEHW